MQTFDELVKTKKVRFRNYIEDAAKNEKGIEDTFFAESLSGLIKNADPADFFERTELVPNFEALVINVLERVSSISDQPAFVLDTVMGGGKTHALAYIYFLFKERDVAVTQEDVTNLLRKVNKRQIPEVDVIAVDGNDLDVRLGLQEQEPFKPFLMEGGNKQSVLNEINKRGKPVLFLLDEMLDYFVKRGENFNKDLAYLKTLVEGLAETKNSALIISIPSDFSDRAKYETVKDLFASMHRRATSFQPVKGSEDLYAIIRKQIFEAIDNEKAREAADYAKRVYNKEGLREDREKFELAFPFHPDLIEIIGERFSQFENFQKTREILKLLASIAVDVLKRVYSGEKFETPFITPGDVDLGAIKSKITAPNIFKITNLEIIVEKDVLSASKLERKLATVVYLYSLFPDPKRAGADSVTIYKALLLENISPEDIEKKLNDYIDNKATYIDRNKETKRFYINGKPTIYALINRKQNEIEDSSKEIEKRLQKMLSINSDEVYVMTSKQEPVEGKLNIAVFPPTKKEFNFDRSPEENAKRLAEEWEIFSKNNKNGNVLLYPVDPSTFSSLLNEGRRVLAIEELKKEFSDKETRDKLEAESENSDQRITSLIMRTYRGLLWSKNGYKSIEIDSVTNENDYFNSIINSLSNNEKAYTKSTLKNLNLQDYFKELLGDRYEYNTDEAYDDIKESLSIPFLTRSAFVEALNRAVDEKIIMVVDENKNAVRGIIGRDYTITWYREAAKPASTSMVEPAEPAISAAQPEAPEARYENKIIHRESYDKVMALIKDLNYVKNFAEGEFYVNLKISANGSLDLKVKSSNLSKLINLLQDLKDLLGDSLQVSASVELNKEQYSALIEYKGEYKG